MSATNPGFDVLAIGRGGVDIYPLADRRGARGRGDFGKFLGGSAANVAVAAARLGNRSALISGVGDDPFGRFVRRALTSWGSTTGSWPPTASIPTPVTFCEIFPPDHFPLYFYRKPIAPDLLITPDELDLDAIARRRLFWVDGDRAVGRAEPVAHFAAWEARGRGAVDGAGSGLPADVLGHPRGRRPNRCSALCRTYRRDRQQGGVRDRGRRDRPARGRRCAARPRRRVGDREAGPERGARQDQERSRWRCHRTRSRWSTGWVPGTASGVR